MEERIEGREYEEERRVSVREGSEGKGEAGLGA